MKWKTNEIMVWQVDYWNYMYSIWIYNLNYGACNPIYQSSLLSKEQWFSLCKHNFPDWKVFFIAAYAHYAFALLLKFSLMWNQLSKVNNNNNNINCCNIYPWVPRSAPGIGRRVEHLSSLWVTFSQSSSSEKSSQSDSPLQRSDWLIQRPGKTNSHSHKHTICPPYAHTNRGNTFTLKRMCCLGGCWWDLPDSLQVKSSPQ